MTFTSPPFETTLDTTALTDGTHTLAAVARDGLGNTSATVSIAIVVDNTPPVVAIVRPAGGTVVSGSVPFEVSVSDACSGVVQATTTVAGVATPIRASLDRRIV